eukprot:TRINITY_DN31537_c0_g2_i1.p1 TRINITY_DN31537_c0_g2~~TRINITY_DN31537_c0_g2_i1.p1  ORF type:complete len:551 (+),score=164.50 TRINITY_DN31537_c0_g2_i1:79-1653(+)
MGSFPCSSARVSHSPEASVEKAAAMAPSAAALEPPEADAAIIVGRSEPEAYLQKHELRPLLEKLLQQVAGEQPRAPVAALRRLLLEAERAEAEGLAEAPPEDDVDTAPAETCDPMRLLTEEELPGKKSAAPDTKQKPAVDLSQKRRWAGGFNRPLLEGWLPQPSPCCAAASTAGAFNALWGYSRKDESSASIREVAELMAQHCERLQRNRQQRIERLLGLTEEGTLGQALEVLDEELLTRGLDWKVGKGEKAVTRKLAMDVLCEVAEQRSAPKTDDAAQLESGADNTQEEAAPGEGPKEDVFAVLRTALKADDAALGDEGEAGVAEDGGSLPFGGLVVAAGPNWETEFGELFAKRKGARRLRAEKPHTGEIGSWGLKQAAEDLSAKRGCDMITVHTLLGRKSNLKVEVQLEKGDNAAAVERQWSVLKSAFGKPNSVLLFHLTNHYALIFAWREWHEESEETDEPKIRRQILTARKGQKPTAWMDWEEARSIILGWSGYHILQLQRQPGSAMAPAVGHEHAELGA